MTDIIRDMQAMPLPSVVIERWTGNDGWPVLRVFYLAPLFGETGERYIEASTHAEALEDARVLAGCTGWPIDDRTKGFECG